MNKVSTLLDFVTDYIGSNYSVRPDTLDSMGPKVQLAIVELQKNNIFPETTISFESLDMKDEKRDSADALIFNYYTLPDDFRQLFNKGPAFEVEGKSEYGYVDYSTFLRIRNSTRKKIFTIHRFNGEYGPRNRLIAEPFPDDTDTVHVSYYSRGLDLPIDSIDQDYYMPVIDHVLNQLNLRPAQMYQDGVVDVKRNQQNPAGQGSYHNSFAKTKPRFFGNHRTRGFRLDSRRRTRDE